MKIIILFLLSFSLFSKIREINIQQLTQALPLSAFDYTGFDVPLDDSNSDETGITNLVYLDALYNDDYFIGLKLSERAVNKFIANDEALLGIRKSYSQVQNHYMKILKQTKHRFKIYRFKNEVYAFLPHILVNTGRNQTFGLSFSFTKRNKNVVYLNKDNFSIGFNFDPAYAYSNLGGSETFNLASGLNDLFNFRGLKQTDHQSSLDFAIKSYISFQKSYLSLNSKIEKTYTAKFNHEFKMDDYEPLVLNEPVEYDDFSRKLKRQNKALKKAIKKKKFGNKKYTKSTNFNMVVNDQETNQFLQSICDVLAKSINFPKEVWPRCRLQATYSPNAFALPDGQIMVTAGLLGMLSNLDSLIFVLGHELGHVLGMHSRGRLKTALALHYTQMAVSQALTFYSLGTGPEFLRFLPWYPKAMATQYLGTYALYVPFLSMGAGFGVYMKSQEKESDAFGQELSMIMGAKKENILQGQQDFLDFHKKYFSHSKVSIVDKLLASHPSWEKRMKLVNKRAKSFQKLKKYASNKNSDLAELFAQIHNKFKGPTHQWAQEKEDKFAKSKDLRDSYSAEANHCLFHTLGMY